MGIGRREFIALASAALVGVVVDPLQAVITSDDAYVNRKMGIMFHKPSSWGFINVRDFGKLKDKQILGNGWNDIEDVWEVITEPICIATKYSQDKPENKGVFSPTITLNVTHKSEFEDMEIESFEELISMSEFGASRILKDFKVVKRYDPYYINECKFYEFDAEYTFEHIDLAGPLKVELKVLKAEHGNFYYNFNCHQSITAKQTATEEFEAFKRSIVLL